jgi:hypothetical protein
MNFKPVIWLFILLFSSAHAGMAQGFTAHATYSLNYLSDYGKLAREAAFGLRYQHPDRWGLELEGGQTAYAHYQPDFSRGLENQMHQSWNARLGFAYAVLNGERFKLMGAVGPSYRAGTDFVAMAVYYGSLPSPQSPDEPIGLDEGLYVLQYDVRQNQHLGGYAAITGTYRIGRKWGAQVRASYEQLGSVQVIRGGTGLFIQL